MARQYKTVVIIPDGMAEFPLAALGGRTPMEAAKKPHMDLLAALGTVGTVRTVPEGIAVNSDPAAFSILGYDPAVYSRGRAPLEAVSMGLEMGPDDTAIRCNLVTLSEGDMPFEERVMNDNSAGEIGTEDARALVEALDAALGRPGRRFHTGKSYRHCLMWENAPEFAEFTPPHDIIGRKIGEYLPHGPNSSEYLKIMRESYDILAEHPINERRRSEGKLPGNAAWLWSPGKKPALPQFRDLYGLTGTVAAAVDLIQGIGLCAGLKAPAIPGATGRLDTDYAAKAAAAMAALEAGDGFVLIHVEAPDECSHQGDHAGKVRAIELIDQLIVGPMSKYLRTSGGPFRVLVMPDHLTSCETRTHAVGDVPFALYDSLAPGKSGVSCFTEAAAAGTGVRFPTGHGLLPSALKGGRK